MSNCLGKKNVITLNRKILQLLHTWKGWLQWKISWLESNGVPF